jgi:phosphoribosylformylglycinamidine synthase
LVRACHDLSEGGLGVAAAEMAIAGRLGLELDLTSLPRSADVETDVVALFSESSGRFLVEVAPEMAAAFEEMLTGRPAARLGRAIGDGALCVHSIEGGVVIQCELKELARRFFGEEAKTKAL